jgi:NAD(P)-dependent dehydrogenase (short-subunit alcohol dehydrogenase family)
MLRAPSAEDSSMSGRLAGKAALITAAAQGIGKAAALAFANEGARVVLADLNAKGESVAEEIRARGGEAHFVCADLGRPAEVERVVATAIAKLGRLDCAFNNAGIVGAAHPLHEWTLDEFDAIANLNLRGTFVAMKCEIAQMLKQGGGTIVNTCSTLGLIGLGGFVAYSASKHAVAGLTKVAALDYATQGIRVNAIAPGVCRTPGVEEIMASSGGEAAFVAPIPMARLGTPEEIAEVAVWLASDACPFMTGAIVTADGGTVIQ